MSEFFASILAKAALLALEALIVRLMEAFFTSMARRGGLRTA